MQYIFDQVGNCVAKNGTDPMPPIDILRRHYGDGIIIQAYDDDPHPGVDRAAITATIEGGQVVSVHVQEEPTLWLHGSISGGDINPMTGTRYIQRGEQITFNAAIREGADPASDVVANIPDTDPPVPLTVGWALELIHERGLGQYSPYIHMTAGEASGTVTVPDRLPDGLYRLEEGSLAAIGGRRLRLADAAAFEFKVRS